MLKIGPYIIKEFDGESVIIVHDTSGVARKLKKSDLLTALSNSAHTQPNAPSSALISIDAKTERRLKRLQQEEGADGISFELYLSGLLAGMADCALDVRCAAIHDPMRETERSADV